ncbi:MAG: cobaltochelatase subunit CobN [Synechococcus sp.]
MHRLSSLPGGDFGDSITLVEQPPAPVLLLTSAATDLTTLASCLEEPHLQHWHGHIRALPLASLSHPAQIDHYLSTTGRECRLIVVRLLGGRGHWSYGFDQLQQWQQASPGRHLIVLAGTPDQNDALHGLGSVPPALSDRLALLLREGGTSNMATLLEGLAGVLAGEPPDPECLHCIGMADPAPWQWQPDQGPRVGVVLYRALSQSGDQAMANELLKALRAVGLAPRALWVSSLRDPIVQAGVLAHFQQQAVDVVITATSFASVQFEQAGFGAPLWDQLDRPVLQLLSSSKPRAHWAASTRGLDPLDLSLQVVLPELDGRITTRVGGFREVDQAHPSLATAVPRTVPDLEGLAWVAQHARAWVDLQHTRVVDRRIGLVVANYPVRNGRIANGVGLDTPASLLNLLHWMAEAGYGLNPEALPKDSKTLMAQLLSGRTNDPESHHLRPLTHLPLATYQRWWTTVPADARATIEARWGAPEQAIDLEREGFPIHGLELGHVVVLIQPSRGYDPDQLSDLHSPDLPPPHRYLAQYLWMRKVHGTQLLVHLGKHGSAEWLPGKSVGLSQGCGPALALGALPHVYPFIVNDPGEGSQAKRRGQAVILDHLTPPLGRAGSHGALETLEGLLDEYVEANQLGAQRSVELNEQLLALLQTIHWPGLPDSLKGATPDPSLFDASIWSDCMDQVETYLCELKEAQIRTGLHRLGTTPEPDALVELLLAISRAPGAELAGITQRLAQVLDLDLDPWSDEDGDHLAKADQHRLQAFTPAAPRRVADAVAWLEQQAMEVIRRQITPQMKAAIPAAGPDLHPAIQAWMDQAKDPVFLQLRDNLIPRLVACAEQERKAMVRALDGKRLASGPSGAPTRGRPDVLPTGRNFYSVDLRGLPTEAAWDLGRRSAERLLDLYLLEEGEPLQHMALSVWGTATMRNGGEDIAQLLALLGVRPVWDGPTRRMIDLELIPLTLLGRPRVDVTLRISGLFRDAFPQLIRWVHRAQALVAGLEEDESMNPLAALTRQEGEQARIFGSAPGAYGAGLQALIDSGQWDQRDDLGDAFLEWSQWSYDGAGNPQRNRAALEHSLGRVQMVLHNQDNREHDLLDSDDYYQFHGGLAAAITRLKGSSPTLWFADHSRSERLRIHRVEKEIDKVMRSRLLNPRWIEGMQQHGYKGAFEMAASLDYLFAYDAASGVVPDWCYQALQQAWLNDQACKTFLMEHNPWALRDMSERLLEASNRGLWSDAQPSELAQLRDLVLQAETTVETGSLG